MSGHIKTIKPGTSIHDDILVPSDKSITHRAFMLAAIAEGTTIIRDPSYGLDCKSTLSCLHALGVPIDTRGSFIEIKGVGRQGFALPSGTLDSGNSGSTLRMLSGILAGQPIEVTIDGDQSLRKRPLKRIVEPLKYMGADISGTVTSQGETVCPLQIGGRKNLNAVLWKSPIASAQVKTAVLFAGLNAAGKTSYLEPMPSRDHTEIMLPVFGCKITKSFSTKEISLVGPQQPIATEITVCRDFSSAAFFIVLGLLLPDSEITLPDVGINPTRIGLLSVLERMGARITITNQKKWSGEPVGDIMVKSSQLKGITLQAREIPCMIDEIPILAVAASYAQGETIITGAGELKYKESNRLKAIAEGLNTLGAHITINDDGLVIQGACEFIGGSVNSYYDHRIAMALAVAGICAYGETTIQNPSCVDISFPQFWELLEKHVSQ